MTPVLSALRLRDGASDSVFPDTKIAYGPLPVPVARSQPPAAARSAGACALAHWQCWCHWQYQPECARPDSGHHFALLMPGAGFSHILPGFPVLAEGSWHLQLVPVTVAALRRGPGFLAEMQCRPDWHHATSSVPPFLLP
jgi:hypothetical protein